MTHNDNGLGPGQNYGETAVFTFGRKVFFLWPKMRFSQKSTQNLLKDWFLFWKRVLFCSHNFSRSWPEQGVQPEVFFLAWNIGFLAQKSDFCHTTPNFVNGPFVALGEMVYFQPSEQFFYLRPISSQKNKKPKKEIKSCQKGGEVKKQKKKIKQIQRYKKISKQKRVGGYKKANLGCGVWSRVIC